MLFSAKIGKNQRLDIHRICSLNIHPNYSSTIKLLMPWALQRGLPLLEIDAQGRTGSRLLRTGAVMTHDPELAHGSGADQRF